MNAKDLEVVRDGDRFKIVDKGGKLVDNAQGYGFKTSQKAKKYIWYKFGGGKQKIDDIKSFWRKNRQFSKKLSDLYMDWYKEIARNEVNFEEEAKGLAIEMGVEGFDVKFLKHLEF